jgi:hypothetical protein
VLCLPHRKPRTADFYERRQDRPNCYRTVCRKCRSKRAAELSRSSNPLKRAALGYHRPVATDPKREPQIICKECCSLPHRRHWNGCGTCGEPHEPEPELDVCDFSRRYWNRELV